MIQAKHRLYSRRDPLKIEISRAPRRSALVCLPEATASTWSNSLSPALSRLSPWATVPALKSIQLPFFSKRAVLVEIFTVGAGAPKGVPRPVVNRIKWAPAAMRAVADTKSLPGPESRFRPFRVTASP